MARFNPVSKKFHSRPSSGYLSEFRALDAMGTGAKLMLIHDLKSKTGKSFYIVPGGPVESEVAEKLIARPNIQSNNDGLLPETPQSWSIMKA